jgi:hypothetical protein
MKPPTLDNLEQLLALTLCALFCLAGFTFKAFAPFLSTEYYQRLSQEGSELLQQGLGFGFGTGAVSGAVYLRRKKDDETDT